MSLGIKKGDTVVVTTGKDKGKTGRVLSVQRDEGRVVVEGVNVVKKHRRRRSEQQQSGIVDMPAPVHVSNLALWCAPCKKGVRTSVQVNPDKSKTRLCKKCGNQL